MNTTGLNNINGYSILGYLENIPLNFSDVTVTNDLDVNNDVDITNNLDLAGMDIDEIMTQSGVTGFNEWATTGPYWSATGDQFTLLVGGNCLINGKYITWTAPQVITMNDKTDTHICIDTSGIIAKTTHELSHTTHCSLFTTYYESTTPSLLVFKENHEVLDNGAEIWKWQNSLGSHFIEGSSITTAKNNTGDGTTQDQVQITMIGNSILADGRLNTSITGSTTSIESACYYQNASSEWIQCSSSINLPMSWNNSGVITALGANKFGTYTIYGGKDDLNTTTPQYFVLIGDQEFNTQVSAQNYVNDQLFPQLDTESREFEVGILSVVIAKNNGTYGSVQAIDIIIASVGSNTTAIQRNGTNASGIATDITNFDGILSATDTNVQEALETIDEIATALNMNAGSVISMNSDEINISESNHEISSKGNLTMVVDSNQTSANIFYVKTGAGSIMSQIDESGNQVVTGNMNFSTGKTITCDTIQATTDETLNLHADNNVIIRVDADGSGSGAFYSLQINTGTPIHLAYENKRFKYLNDASYTSTGPTDSLTAGVIHMAGDLNVTSQIWTDVIRLTGDAYIPNMTTSGTGNAVHVNTADGILYENTSTITTKENVTPVKMSAYDVLDFELMQYNRIGMPEEITELGYIAERVTPTYQIRRGDCIRGINYNYITFAQNELIKELFVKNTIMNATILNMQSQLDTMKREIQFLQK